MKFRLFAVIQIILLLILSSGLIFAQQSQNSRPQSYCNKKIYKQNQSHKSTLGKPDNATNHKKKNFTVNRNKTINRKIRQKENNYNDRREKSNITMSENYFHIDESGNSLWDGKHWDLDEYPLKVFVKESSSRYYKSIYKEYVDYAFNVWQKADNRIKYAFTNSSRDADVVFVFVENLGKKYEENYLGLTEYETNSDKEIEYSKVQISLLKFGKETISAGEIKATIVHELGHAFGLGHSKSEKDIMYPYISSDHSSKMTYDELSRGDKEAIKDVIDLGDDDKYVWK